MQKSHSEWSHGVRLGQNFLKDMAVASSIVSAATALKPKIAVEIGPGRGAITFMLSRQVERLTAIEKDEFLAAKMARETASLGNVEILEDDALRVDFRGLIGGSGEGAVLVANLPYYLSTLMLRKAFQEAAFKRMVFMLQLEVAQKVCAKAGGEGYGPISIARWASHDSEILFEVSPSAFDPVPAVKSAVIMVKRTENKTDIPFDRLMKFTDAAFMARRKNIKNALLGSILKPNADDLAKALAVAGLTGTERAEEIPEEKMARLASMLI
jgi:16S rRNA (adenine1518-N6/adenine1519-N6)-dimethyltransferase